MAKTEYIFQNLTCGGIYLKKDKLSALQYIYRRINSHFLVGSLFQLFVEAKERCALNSDRHGAIFISGAYLDGRIIFVSSIGFTMQLHRTHLARPEILLI